jgi:Fe-S-cluster-containing dehydrogenase component
MLPTDSTNYASPPTGVVTDDATTVQNDDLVVVKAQKGVDNGPYVRYGCWHCVNPPCAPACPRNAIVKLSKDYRAHGAVVVDYGACTPDTCGQPCIAACRKGGYPKIGNASVAIARKLSGGTIDLSGKNKMYKCDMCWERVEDGKLPKCVATCPAKAYTFDTYSNIWDKLTADRYAYISGNDQFVWATRNTAFVSPKADPFIEDHISPMVDRLLSGPFSKAFLAPTAVVGGLYALYRRRVNIAEEEALREGV